NAITRCDFKKLSMCHTVSFSETHFSLCLPFHKADHYYQGNTILVKKHSTPSCLLPVSLHLETPCLATTFSTATHYLNIIFELLTIFPSPPVPLFTPFT
ncbi:hypothetical protein K439DRAFT_1347993, partial [Ramaria rubella]